MYSIKVLREYYHEYAYIENDVEFLVAIKPKIKKLGLAPDLTDVERRIINMFADAMSKYTD